MKVAVKHYLNDIVSITVLSLMTVALIAAQSGPENTGIDDLPAPPVLRAEIDVQFGAFDGVIEASFQRRK